jgi:signal transduction histidine kinase/CheY-like chemotaxis protein
VLKQPSIIVRAVAFVVIVCLCVIAIDSWRSWNVRSAKLHDMTLTTVNLTRATAQQADDTLKEADTTLVDIVERIEYDGINPANIARLHRFLKTRIAELTQLDGLFVYDENGKWIVDAQRISPRNLDNSDQEYFIFHRTHSDLGSHIGAPGISRSTGKLIIPLSRRINHADGSFGGVVLATIDIDFFKAFYRTLQIGQEGAVELVAENGILMVRRPFNNSSTGESLLNTRLLRSYGSQGPIGMVFITSTDDGVTRLYSYRRLKNYPLFVSTALSKDEILGDWWRDTLWHTGGACFLVIVVSLFGWRLVRQIELRIKAEAKAEAANRAKGEFLASMSHELRTPLNGILGYAQILQRDNALSQQQRDGVTVIQRSGEHLLSLINDTLDFARIEAGKLRLEIGDVPLRGLVDVIREIIGVKAEQKHLEFVCEIAADATSGVRADERRLRQVLLNLLANAVKFTDQGCVSLRVMRLATGFVRFEVRDTGIGIPTDKLGTIFEPFEQLGSPDYGAGTGLGLVISRQFVRAMGSDIYAESRDAQGSAFWFDLAPTILAMPDTSAASPTRIAIGYEGPRRKVLIIDDVPVNRAVITELLDRLGFETAQAATGREGLAKVQSERPALILTDILMPEMDGLETTRRLRQLPYFSDVPIIAMSASASGSEEKKSLAAGVHAFVPKPVDFELLLATIARLLKLKWTYAVRTHIVEPDAATGPPLAPTQEMDELYRLARLGDMREIVLWADRVAALDIRYRPFAAQLRILAKGYQSKAILLLVEQHLERRPTP